MVGAQGAAGARRVAARHGAARIRRGDRHAAPAGEVIELGDVRQKSGKVVTAFAVEGDLDVSTVVSNTFEMVWPPRSGRMQTFPEVDRAQWCGLDEARVKLNSAQAEFVGRLESALGDR
ncbi:NUDIX hydrolase [Mycobacteroides abscessus subsp. abscessus]|nr:NUDIX hydrolase [Mycobacteroides abscessus subsp. abscessus]